MSVLRGSWGSPFSGIEQTCGKDFHDSSIRENGLSASDLGGKRIALTSREIKGFDGPCIQYSRT